MSAVSFLPTGLLLPVRLSDKNPVLMYLDIQIQRRQLSNTLERSNILEIMQNYNLAVK